MRESGRIMEIIASYSQIDRAAAVICTAILMAGLIRLLKIAIVKQEREAEFKSLPLVSVCTMLILSVVYTGYVVFAV